MSSEDILNPERTRKDGEITQKFGLILMGWYALWRGKERKKVSTSKLASVIQMEFGWLEE